MARPMQCLGQLVCTNHQINRQETTQMNKSLIKILGSLVMASAIHQAANALPFINGEIDLAASGSFVSVDFAKNTVKFTPGSPTLNATVTYADGEWASLIGSKATYFNFKYDAPGVSPIPL